jgi:hypothetical protein
MQLREHALKGERALLIPSSKDKRRDWTKAQAVALDYRWPIVKGLLADLAGAR